MYPGAPFENLRSFIIRRTTLSNLILINIVVFLVINLTNLLFWLFQLAPNHINTGVSQIAWWLAVPSDLERLLLKPWSLFTYMFVQEEFLHILFNMIMLYFSGQLFVTFLNERKLLSTYILGGIAGGLLYIVSYNIFPVFKDELANSVAIGASASVLSILIAIAVYQPNLELRLMLFGKVKLKYLALVFVLIDLLSIQNSNAGGHLAHLGGAIWGFLYIKIFMDKFSLGRWANKIRYQLSWKNLFTRPKGPRKYSGNTSSRPLTDDEYNKQRNDKQAEIDSILDKIASKGYDGLTREEKETLFKSGKK